MQILAADSQNLTKNDNSRFVMSGIITVRGASQAFGV